jgi:hypothetical protein
MEIRYINTDLDLAAPYDLTPLVTVLEAGGIFPIHQTQQEDGEWSATLETSATLEKVLDFNEPEATIVAMLDVIESLGISARGLWDRCSLREFNIGYDCGDEPFAVHNGLSHTTLLRVTSVGAGLRITLYSANLKSQAS